MESGPYRSLASYFDAKTKSFVTIVLVLIGLLFVWSNNSDGAGVRLQLTAAINKPAFIPGKVWNWIDSHLLHYNKEVFSFTLLSAVKDFWDSRSYGLSIIIAVFSGFWPYIKLVLLMITWLQPMHETTRSRMLFFLDQFGKFSLVDLYVCVYMIVSFYFVIEEPPVTSPLHNDIDIKVNVYVNPKLGMYTFVIGTLASVFINHFLIWLDETRSYYQDTRATLASARRDESNPRLIKTRGEDDVLGSSAVLIPTDISEDRLTECSSLFLRVPPASGLGILMRAFMMVWMVVIMWATVQSFISAPVRFGTGGLAGAFAHQPVRAYNLVQVIEKVPNRTHAKAVAYFLDIVFTATLIVFPAIVCLLCFTLWFLPMPGRVCRFLGVFVLPMNSLACIEVFWMAGIAASLELERVSKWIIDQNKSFSGVCTDIEALTHLDCFSVKGKLLSGCWWMLVAGFGLWSVVWYTRYTLNEAFGPREDPKADPVYYDVDFGVD